MGAIVRFGPNVLEGVLDETGISNYLVFMVDGCSRKVGAPVASVVQRPGFEPACCESRKYEAEITAQLLENTTSATFMIVGNTSVGELPIGVLTNIVEDFVGNETVRKSKPRSAALQASPAGCAALL